MIKQGTARELVQSSKQVNKQVGYFFQASLNGRIRAVNAHNARATCRISSRMLFACMTRDQKPEEYSAGLALIALLLLFIIINSYFKLLRV